jgi:hypothetical protein
MMSVRFSSPIVGLFSVGVPALVRFSFLTGEVLMQLPKLDLQIFERISAGLAFRVGLQITPPAVLVLPENVFRGMHQGKYSWTFQMRK